MAHWSRNGQYPDTDFEKSLVRGSERLIGGSRGQLEGLRAPIRIWGPARGSGGQPEGWGGAAGGSASSSWGDGKHGNVD